MICLGVLVMWCNLAKPPVVDSFCTTYQPVVLQKGDGIITTTPGAKRRILANEIVYRTVCGGKK